MFVFIWLGLEGAYYAIGFITGEHIRISRLHLCRGQLFRLAKRMWRWRRTGHQHSYSKSDAYAHTHANSYANADQQF